MKKVIVKVIMIVGLCLLGILIVLVAFFCIVSTGEIRTYTDEEGNPLPGSISEKFEIEINGAMNGFMINGTNLDNPVLLFVNCGPGTDAYFFNEKYKDMHLEDEYTICYWNYRGMCMVYDPEIDPESITKEVLMEDVKAVTDYLKERFGREKIFIMGFSGGTNIAINAVKNHPEDYYAYIGMAQVITHGADNDQLIYDFMKKIFTERGDKRRLRRLEQMVSYNTEGKAVAKSWPEFVYLLHEAGGGTTYNETEFVGIDIPIMLSHCYTVNEKLDYIRGMKMYRKTRYAREIEGADYRVELPELEIPVYFLSGEYDYNCPWALVEEYCNMLKAPDKGFYKIKGAAHSPLWERSEVCYEIMKEIKEKNL